MLFHAALGVTNLEERTGTIQPSHYLSKYWAIALADLNPQLFDVLAAPSRLYVDRGCEVLTPEECHIQQPFCEAKSHFTHSDHGL
jgi:hypothetical protein